MKRKYFYFMIFAISLLLVSCIPVEEVTKPSAPSNLSAEVLSSTEIKLTWQDNSTNEEGFKIERKEGETGSFNQITTVTADTTQYTDSELSPNTTYYYRVRAYNSGGDSNYSNEINATTHDVAPNAPSNLSAEVLSSTEIKLTWTDNSTNEEGFKIERKTEVEEWSQIKTVEANTTQYTDSGLSANTMYYYRVRAYNSAGDSSYSNEANATTYDVAPNAPTNLSAEVLSSTEIKLTWTDNSTNEEGFKIERKTEVEEWSQITTVTANTTQYTDSGLSPNTTYYYRARAYNSAGDSSYSNEANATTYDVAPNAPSNLSAEVLSSTEIKLTWTDNSTNEEEFKIERKEGETGSFSQITTVTANTTQYTDSGLSANTTYYYRVRAYNSVGDSNYSNEINATTLLLNAPSNLQAQAISPTEIKLTWTDNSTNEEGFKIERKVGTSGSWSEIATVGANKEEYTDNGLTLGTTYYYWIYAYNSVGTSSYSNQANATTQLKQVGYLNTTVDLEDVYVNGNYAYLANWYYYGLVIADVSDPTNPRQVGYYDTAGSSFGVYVNGNYAYVADAYNGLVILDISDPTNPKQVGHCDTAGSSFGVYVNGNYAYVADDTNGLVILDITDPTNPKQAGHYNRAVNSWDVYVNGNYAYVADAYNGLVIVDVTDPTNPKQAGHYDTAGWARGVFVHDNYAYVADDYNGLVIVDVTDPTNPKQAGQYNTAGSSRGVFVHDNYAYVADDTNGLVIVDVTDHPTYPKQAGQYDTAGYSYDVYVKDDYAYVADWGNGLVIVDISYFENLTF